MRWLILAVILHIPSAVLWAEPAPIHLLNKPDAFETLVNPPCSHCRIEAQRRAKEFRDDDRVLCWIRGYSDGGAIPFRFFLNNYRVISDTYGVFVYDSEAGFARGFAPSLDFKFQGWRNGVMVIKHKDGTLYSALTGKAFEGPNAGAKLEPVPTLVSQWGDWLEQYPDTVAYHMFDKYQPTELPADELSASRQTRGRNDPRLPEDELVLGVTSGERARAYRINELTKSGLVNERIGNENWTVLWNGPTRTAAAYLSVAHPPDNAAKAQVTRPITLRLVTNSSKTQFVDKETNSHWDIAGRAVDGELKGWTLQWLDGTQVKWFAWVAEYPKTTIHDVAESSR
jgi:hypothetical protein